VEQNHTWLPFLVSTDYWRGRKIKARDTVDRRKARGPSEIEMYCPVLYEVALYLPAVCACEGRYTKGLCSPHLNSTIGRCS
jgi:hypothetical protein